VGQDNILLFVSVGGLGLILALNVVFPPFVAETSQKTMDFRWTTSYGLLDDNSTIRLYGFAGDYDIQARETQHSSPPSWFNLTLRRPFEIFSNWTKIYLRVFLSTGTYGRAAYSWTLSWRLYNVTTAFSDSWTYMLDVDPDYKYDLERNDIEYDISREDRNSSIYNPARWIFEANLVHNATMLSYAHQYQAYYNLRLEVSEETSATNSTSNIRLSDSFYLSLAAASTMVLVILLQTVARTKKHRVQ